MTDDLVKRADAFRLGASPTDDQVEEANRILDRMSSRIEELEAKLEEMTQAWQAACDVTDLAGKLVDTETKLAQAVEALETALYACDRGRMIPRPGCGIGGMTIEVNIKGSIYTGVPAWPIEEARTTLAELKKTPDA
mgnify:CR=1 FL=1